MTLPEPMLARSGSLPDAHGHAFELKWDGFRAIVRAGECFGIRSRRGWNMTPLVPELAALPVDAVLDGELVALGEDGWPYFPLVCERLLNGRRRIPLLYIIFDVLELDGQRTTHLPYRERRRLLDGLGLDGPSWRTSAVFDDGQLLFAVAQEQGLEGVVAKRLASPYRSGQRGWVKVKNRHYWRYPLEVDAAYKRARAAPVALTLPGESRTSKTRSPAASVYR
jgi:bifunctional non-homologous end joining protein LigD